MAAGTEYVPLCGCLLTEYLALQCHYSQVPQQQRTCLFLFQGCDGSFLSAFPSVVFEHTGGIPRLILLTYTIVHAWTCIRSKRDGTRANKLTVEDIPQALKHVFDYLYRLHQVCCCSVTAQRAIIGV